MNFAFTEEQEELRETARAFLAEHASSDQVRTAMESEGHRVLARLLDSGFDDLEVLSGYQASRPR